jgi:hypothetical protein
MAIAADQPDLGRCTLSTKHGEGEQGCRCRSNARPANTIIRLARRAGTAPPDTSA